MKGTETGDAEDESGGNDKRIASEMLGPVAIAERLNITRKTVSNYMVADEFQEKPTIQKAEQPSKLDPFKPLIRQWLEEDRKNRYKQQHTAMRIHKRYDASYPLVHRYVKSLREYRYA